MEVQRLDRLPAVDRALQVGHYLRNPRPERLQQISSRTRSIYSRSRAFLSKTASQFLETCSSQISFVRSGEATFLDTGSSSRSVLQDARGGLTLDELGANDFAAARANDVRTDDLLFLIVGAFDEDIRLELLDDPLRRVLVE